MENIFFDIGAIIIMATIAGYIAKAVKQPLIPAYILTGLLIGPFGIGLIRDINTIRLLAEIGIAFLLFIVGLEIDLKRLKDTGIFSALGGTIQILLLFSIGASIAFYFLGFSSINSIYIGLVLVFSSTMVIVKLLSDKKALNTLHGRMIIGLLLIEDIFAVFALSILNNLTELSKIFLAMAILKAVIIITFTIFSSKYVFPSLFRFGARSQELLFLLSVTVCFWFTIMANYFDFSITIGAFAAGVALANLPYRYEIIGRVSSLKDFFSTIFFVTLGMQLMVSALKSIMIPVIIFTLFVLLFKPLVTMLLGNLFGYSKRTSFLTAISLPQTSEFGLIIAAQGLLLGHISQEIFSIAILIAVITMTLTAYILKYDTKIYYKLSGLLKLFDSLGTKKQLEYVPRNRRHRVILVGYDRIGYRILQQLKKMKKSTLVVDFNPDVIKRLMKQKVPCLYGDISDHEIIERLDLKKADTVICTSPSSKDNAFLLSHIKDCNKKATVFLTASSIKTALDLYDKGADYVIIPHLIGGHHVSSVYKSIDGKAKKLINMKTIHINELREIHEFSRPQPFLHTIGFRKNTAEKNEKQANAQKKL